MLFWDSYGITTTFNSCKTFQSSLTVARLYNFANELHIFGPTCENVFFFSSSSCKRVNTVRLGVWRSWSESKFSFIFLSVEKTSQQLGEKYHNHCSVFGIWAMTFFSSKWCLACLRYNNNVNFFYTSRYFTGKFFYMYIFHPINTMRSCTLM